MTDNTPDKEKKGGRNRSRTSFYLDKDTTLQVDKAYREVAHDLYPLEIDKSDFLEALFSFGLTHLDEIKKLLTQQQA